MNERDRANVLKTKHADLQNELEQQKKFPHPDDIVLADLKRQKLRIKDELMSMNAL